MHAKLMCAPRVRSHPQRREAAPLLVRGHLKHLNRRLRRETAYRHGDELLGGDRRLAHAQRMVHLGDTTPFELCRKRARGCSCLGRDA